MRSKITQKHKWLSFAIFLLICFCIEILGGLLTDTSVHSWYSHLIKPSFNPPSWLFGPVWTILYFLIGISGWIVFTKPKSQKKNRALSIYSIQLLLNLLWSFFFFFLRSPFLGVIDILLLFASIIWTVTCFWPLSRLASLLLLPYLLWTGYAVILNISIAVLN